MHGHSIKITSILLKFIHIILVSGEIKRSLDNFNFNFWSIKNIFDLYFRYQIYGILLVYFLPYNFLLLKLIFTRLSKLNSLSITVGSFQIYRGSKIGFGILLGPFSFGPRSDGRACSNNFICLKLN